MQDVSPDEFAAKLKAVFNECHRVLKDDGLLVFSYHHSRSEGWSSLAEAVVGAGFSFVNAHPVKAEMSVATPKSQAKEPIQLDVIIVCRKSASDLRPTAKVKVAFANALNRASGKLARLRLTGFQLSRNDQRVTLISQFLAEACPGRSSPQLILALDEMMSALDLAAEPAGETNVAPPEVEQEFASGQLVLLESHSSAPVALPGSANRVRPATK